jgi:hypothetical protein
MIEAILYALVSFVGGFSGSTVGYLLAIKRWSR